jgi:hypothetical protein
LQTPLQWERVNRLRGKQAVKTLGGAVEKESANKVLGHDPEKWEPVFRKDHAPTKSEKRCRDSI